MTDAKTPGLTSKVSVVAKRIIGGRWLAVAASLAVSGAMIYAQDKESKEHHAVPVAAPSPSLAAVASIPSVPVMSAAPAPAPAGPPVDAPAAANNAEAQMLMANAPAAAQDFRFPLSPGKAPEQGLQIHTIWVARAINVMFMDIQTIGGYRQDPLQWHPNGLAIDVMIPNYHTPEGIELGNQIAGYALANAKRFGILHVIWRQGFYPGIGAPSWTADYGNETANHFDHVHIATDGGGYPTGHETYYLDSMTP